MLQGIRSRDIHHRFSMSKEKIASVFQLIIKIPDNLFLGFNIKIYQYISTENYIHTPQEAHLVPLYKIQIAESNHILYLIFYLIFPIKWFKIFIYEVFMSASERRLSINAFPCHLQYPLTDVISKYFYIPIFKLAGFKDKHCNSVRLLSRRAACAPDA